MRPAGNRILSRSQTQKGGWGLVSEASGLECVQWPDIEGATGGGETPGERRGHLRF